MLKRGSRLSAAQAILWLFAASFAVAFALDVALVGVIGRRMAGWRTDVFPWGFPPSVPAFVYLASYLFLLGIGLTLVVIAIAVWRHRTPINEYFGVLPAWQIVGGAVLAVMIALASLHVSPGTGEAAVGFAVCLIAGLGLRILFAPAPRRRARLIWPLAALIIGVSPLVYSLGVRAFDVPNEFLTLPSQTRLASGRLVDTIGYFNAHGLEGLHIADPRHPDPDANRITVTLKPFSNSATAVAVESFVARDLAGRWFDPTSLRLELHGGVSLKDYLFFAPLVVPMDQSMLAHALVQTEVRNKNEEIRQLSPAEKNFLRRNRAELAHELVLGRYFYHHAYTFGPILRGILTGHLVHASQYGQGLTRIFSLLLAPIAPVWRFNAYLLLCYISYALYGAVLWLLMGRLGFTPWPRLFALCVLVAGYLVPHLGDVRLGVGLSPWRHPLDIVALFLLHRFVAERGWRHGLSLAITIGVATWWSRETGLFIGAAVIGYLALETLLERKRARRLEILVVIVAVALALGWIAGNPHAQINPENLLIGINTPWLTPHEVPGLAALMLLLGLAWWRFRPGPAADPRQKGEFALIGAALAYCAAANIYYLWYPSPNHVVLLIGALALALPAAWRLYGERFGSRDEAWGRVAMVGMSLAILLLGAVRWREAMQERAAFVHHQVYEWALPAGHLTSTADPAFLLQALDEIRHYNPAPGVNILSPWSVMVPFADKYTSGPFVLNFDALAYPSDVATLVGYLLRAPNPMLFVDSRLMRGEYEGFAGTVVGAHNFADGGKARIAALVMLRKVFAQIEPCYQRVAQGPLLDVYRRRSDTGLKDGACHPPAN